MRTITSVILLLVSATLVAQTNDPAATETRSWNFGGEANFYFIKDNFFVNPIITADHEWLHLETRYNYEDFQTTSFFVGYNFSVEKKINVDFTPMIGIAGGNTKGVVPGIELTVSFGKWEFYTETEWLYSPEDKANNFFYSWSELTYAPSELIYFGISGQRTRLYQTTTEIEKGFLLGFTFGKVFLAGYVFNPFDKPFLLLSAGIDL